MSDAAAGLFNVAAGLFKGDFAEAVDEAAESASSRFGNSVVTSPLAKAATAKPGTTSHAGGPASPPLCSIVPLCAR